MFPAEMTVWLECSKNYFNKKWWCGDNVGDCKKKDYAQKIPKKNYMILLVIMLCLYLMCIINIDIYSSNMLLVTALALYTLIQTFFFFQKVSFCAWQWKAQWVVSENAYSFRLESYWLYHSSQANAICLRIFRLRIYLFFSFFTAL